MMGRLVLLAILGLTACAPAPQSAPNTAVETVVESFALIDHARNRPTPVVLYRPVTPGPHRLAILSHGYGAQPQDYGFIARHLAERGWLVAAIDHELPGDAPVPSTGEPRVVRMPNWRIGADSIGFVADQLSARGLAISAPVLLVGHSNGGDMDMLFATENPERVAAVISLDNRRMPFPREGRVPILTLRSNDQVADAGVIPDQADHARLRIVAAPVAVSHNDMWDGATEAQKAQMTSVIDAYLDANGA